MMRDPERGYEAIKMRIPDRLADLLDHECEIIRERVCMVLTVISGLSDGKCAIVRNKTALENIEKLMFDPFETIRHKNSLLIESISRSWFAADYLVDAGFVKKILDVLPREEELIQQAYLEGLTTIMYGEGKDEALSLGAFEIFVDLMETKSEEVAARAADCLMIITSTYVGKDIAYDTAVLPKLAKLLHHHNVNLYRGAASAIMFCTIKSRAKFRAKEIPNLVDRLVVLCNDWHNRGVQLYSMRALAHICEHPDVRKEVKEKYLDKLEEIIVNSDEALIRHKSILIGIVKWHPWKLGEH
ncbi:hypothetical protein FQR65_LT00554 [Abscondita terminalis]|nr:hypothetical protein FQR65_LT00554 [Abscondita terminalis]